MNKKRFFSYKNYARYIYFEIKIRNYSIIFKKIFKSRKLIENKNVIIILILFSKINIFNESTRCFIKITNEKLKKDLFNNKKTRFSQNN